MSAAQVFDNITAYSMQVGLLVALGSLVPAALRLRIPRARLLFWQILLAACLALPWIRPWRHQVVNVAIQASAAIAPAAAALSPVRRALPIREIALWLLAAGTMLRLCWLAAGLTKLAAYRRRGQPMSLAASHRSATLLLSDDVPGPVTFGWRKPVV